MAFNKRTWKGRQGVGLNKFSINGASPVTVVNQPDSITEVGDALSAGNLNDLEDRIAEAFDETASQEEVTSEKNALTRTINSFSIDEIAKETATFYIGSNGGINNSPSWKGWIIDVRSIRRIVNLSLYTNNSGWYAVAFYSGTPSSSTFISGVSFSAEHTVIDAITSIPSGTAYICVCTRTATSVNYNATFVVGLGQTDESLTVRGKSADAKTTGDKLEAIFLSLPSSPIDNNVAYEGAYIDGNVTDGSILPSSSWKAWTIDLNKIPLKMVINVSLCSHPDFPNNYYCIGYYSGSPSSSTFISGIKATSERLNVDYLNFPSGTEYVVLCTRTATSPTYNADLVFDVTEVSKKIDIAISRHYSAFKRYDFLLDVEGIYSDATIVGNKYVGFTSGSDDLTTTAGQIDITTFANGFEHIRTNRKVLYHLWGHCNTVDYNPKNDCLILGNGSGSYTLDGQIFIIPDFSTLIANDNTHTSRSNPLSLTDANAIVIDCSSYDLGTKFNVIWGEDNGQRNDICYLVTAKYGSSTSATDGGDNGTIRRLLLGMGENEFAYGQLVTAQSDEFNGTFKILKTYTQSGTAYPQCNQGSCFYGGKILASIGHDGLWMWEMRLDDRDNSIEYDEYKQRNYALDGTVRTDVNATSICTSDKYLFIGQSNVGVLAIPLN